MTVSSLLLFTLLAAGEFTDNFDDNSLGSMWTTFTAGSASSNEINQQIEFTVPAGCFSTCTAAILTVQNADFQSHFASIHLTQNHISVARSLIVRSSLETAQVSIGETAAGLVGEVNQNNVPIAQFTAPPGANDWVRVGELGGTLYFQVSADGANWTTFGQSPAVFPLTSVQFLVLAYNINTPVSNATASVDDFAFGVLDTISSADRPTSGGLGTGNDPGGPTQGTSQNLKVSGGCVAGGAEASVWMILLTLPGLRGRRLRSPRSPTRGHG